MAKEMFAAAIAGAFCIAALLLGPTAVAARGLGPHVSRPAAAFLARPALLHRHAFRHRHRHSDYFFAGYGSPDASGGADDDVAFPIGFIEASPVFHCRYSRETVTVPAERGGTRKITITRC